MVNQEYYSSELFNATYPVNPSEIQPPGVKWAAKKFNSGIRASAANERFIAMRSSNVDTRPFAGAPYAPSNTFVSTGRMQSSLTSYPALTAFPSETPDVQPRAPHPSAKVMSLAQLLASR